MAQAPAGLHLWHPGHVHLARLNRSETFDDRPFDRTRALEYQPRLGRPRMMVPGPYNSSLADEVKAIQILNAVDEPQPLFDQQFPHHAIHPLVGMDANTPSVINSCTLDGFLTWFCRIIREEGVNVLRYAKTRDPVYQALKDIALHTLGFGNLLSSDYVKIRWLRAVLGPAVDTHLDVIDARGKERHSVMQHLQGHSELEIGARCLCGLQSFSTPYLSLQRKSELRRLQDILDGKRGSLVRLARCSTCRRKRIFEKLTPTVDHWILHVACTKMGNEKLSSLPVTIAVNDQGYRLAFASYGVTYPAGDLNHVYTIHRIKGDFFLHETGISQRLYKLDTDRMPEGPDEVHRLSGLTYYRL